MLTLGVSSVINVGRVSARSALPIRRKQEQNPEHSQLHAVKLAKFLSRRIDPVSVRRNYANSRAQKLSDLADERYNNIRYTVVV